MEAKEGIVLDKEGNTLHDPTADAHKKFSRGEDHMRFVFRGGRANGILPKLVLSAVVIALLFFASGVTAVFLTFVVVATLVRGLMRLFR